eukprot:NODE_222_length_13951_cov_0.396982.p13 type:complete len:109 gc:universal NODE_222_length_13951_cov_0.396982:2106-1780(-)
MSGCSNPVSFSITCANPISKSSFRKCNLYSRDAVFSLCSTELMKANALTIKSISAVVTFPLFFEFISIKQGNIRCNLDSKSDLVELSASTTILCCPGTMQTAAKMSNA